MRLANRRYEGGLSPYSDVLDAQRTVNEAQLVQIQNRLNQLSASVDLMKALGGGWNPEQGGGRAMIMGEEVEARTNGPGGEGDSRKCVHAQIGIAPTLIERERVPSKVVIKEWSSDAQAV